MDQTKSAAAGEAPQTPQGRSGDQSKPAQAFSARKIPDFQRLHALEEQRLQALREQNRKQLTVPQEFSWTQTRHHKHDASCRSTTATPACKGAKTPARDRAYAHNATRDCNHQKPQPGIWRGWEDSGNAATSETHGTVTADAQMHGDPLDDEEEFVADAVALESIVNNVGVQDTHSKAIAQGPNLDAYLSNFGREDPDIAQRRKSLFMGPIRVPVTPKAVRESMYMKNPHDATTAVSSPFRPTPRLSVYRPHIASPDRNAYGATPLKEPVSGRGVCEISVPMGMRTPLPTWTPRARVPLPRPLSPEPPAEQPRQERPTMSSLPQRVVASEKRDGFAVPQRPVPKTAATGADTFAKPLPPKHKFPSSTSAYAAPSHVEVPHQLYRPANAYGTPMPTFGAPKTVAGADPRLPLGEMRQQQYQQQQETPMAFKRPPAFAPAGSTSTTLRF